jgi:hypothetical protein
MHLAEVSSATFTISPSDYPTLARVSNTNTDLSRITDKQNSSQTGARLRSLTLQPHHLQTISATGKFIRYMSESNDVLRIPNGVGLVPILPADFRVPTLQTSTVQVDYQIIAYGEIGLAHK